MPDKGDDVGYKGDDVGYLARTTKDLERILLEMEHELDPILTSIELGDDPRVEWGNGLSHRARQAADCKQRAWTKIADIVQRLADMMTRLDSAEGSAKRTDGSRRVSSSQSAGPKYVNVIIRGTLAEE
jgi:hypothetical protein